MSQTKMLLRPNVFSLQGDRSRASFASIPEFKAKKLSWIQPMLIISLVGGFSPSHLKNMLVKMGEMSLPNFQGEHTKYLKPPSGCDFV